VEKYNVRITRSAAKELEAIDGRADIARLVDAMRSLASEPRPHGAEKLAGRDNRLRVRVGDYRIVYSVNDRMHVVDIVKIGHRREVYR
jgi:mRNA interferase RelE/StbE